MRFVDDNERHELVIENLRVASECVESVRIALHEGFLRNTDEAVAVLDSALDRIKIVHDDLTGD